MKKVQFGLKKKKPCADGAFTGFIFISLCRLLPWIYSSCTCFRLFMKLICIVCCCDWQVARQASDSMNISDYCKIWTFDMLWWHLIMPFIHLGLFCGRWLRFHLHTWHPCQNSHKDESRHLWRSWVCSAAQLGISFRTVLFHLEDVLSACASIAFVFLGCCNLSLKTKQNK